MARNKNIPVDQFCVHYGIEVSFVHSLIEYGLTEYTIVEDQTYLPENKIKDLERMIRMHYDLDINLEGIEAISHLLDRLDTMKEELKRVKNRLVFYESVAR